MRKITFDDATIDAIRDYISAGHSLDETCNKFTLKYDTLRRIMFEHNIEAYYTNKRSTVREVSTDDINLICNLYSETKTRMQDIVKQCKLPNYVVQKIIDDNFTQDYQNRRKAKFYSDSKRGKHNPWYGTHGPNWKGGVVSDGQGYLMVIKPDWYTGRKGSDYIFLHTYVMCESLGLSELPAGFVVHHIDGNPLNNDISNLAMMTCSAHSKLHQLQRSLCKVQRLSDTGVEQITLETPDNG